jgi:hypothetical protein
MLIRIWMRTAVRKEVTSLGTVPSVVTEAMKRLEEKIACAAGLSELIAKLLKEWSRRSDLNR